jgi:hypothetical protein
MVLGNSMMTTANIPKMASREIIVADLRIECENQIE